MNVFAAARVLTSLSLQVQPFVGGIRLEGRTTKSPRFPGQTYNDGFQFKRQPQLQQIKRKKPVKIKLNKTAKDDYSWEPAGDDAEDHHTGPQTQEGPRYKIDVSRNTLYRGDPNRQP